MLEVTKVDLARAETVMKALKRGKYELEGDEVLAFGQCFAWVSSMHDRIKDALETKESREKVTAAPRAEDFGGPSKGKKAK